MEKWNESTVWDGVLSMLQPRLGAPTYDNWFRPTRLLSFDGERLRIAVPNEMFAEWLRSAYDVEIRASLEQMGLDRNLMLEFIPPESVAREPYTDDGSAVEGTPPRSTPTRRAESARPTALRNTFDDFVVSSCNQFAHAAARAVVDQPGRAYNPLFLYGGVGLGKTHLMQAIGNALIEQGSLKIRYLTSEEFMNELINAIRFEETPRFRDRYRSVDVLLVDDVQFLAGKESTQEEFFHTFNALHEAGHQIVLTSDCPPHSIPSLEVRLRSRFEWGLLADIQPPDLETKVAILEKMASARAFELPPEVALFIASQIQSNVRELEGCLTTIIAQASLRHRAADLNLAREVVKMRVPDEREPVTLDATARVVARHFNLKVAELRSKTNARRIAFPRQIAMFLVKKHARESLPAIGLWFGGKHHTTVLHAVRKIEKLVRTDPGIEKLIHQLEDSLGT